MRTIQKVHRALDAHMEGLMTYQAIPTHELRYIDPFILLNHHGPQDFAPNNAGLPFGPHPHRGFETLTFVIEGDVVHKDSTGEESKITTGGVQWMTAGKGVVHSEVSSEEFKEHGGREDLLQLWMNLPSSLKMTDPSYVGLPYKDITHFHLDDQKVQVNLISGHWGQNSGPINSLTELMVSTIEMKAGGELSTQIPKSRNILLYVVRGTVRVNGKEVGTYNTVEFAQDDESIHISTTEESILIFGHGTPNNEPIVSHGPFVMNTKQEIIQAFEDYQNGRFTE